MILHHVVSNKRLSVASVNLLAFEEGSLKSLLNWKSSVGLGEDVEDGWNNLFYQINTNKR